MPDSTPETPKPPQQENKPGDSDQTAQPHRRSRRRFHRPRQKPRDGESPEFASSSDSTGKHQVQERKGGTDISVVIPLYNEEESLAELYQQLRPVLSGMNLRYELLFIDDGSTDRSFDVLRGLRRNDTRIKVVRFRRNFGKSAALSVGFSKARGALVITMDADLQDDPAEIPNLVKKMREGYDLVSGWKKVRHDPITKTVPSRFFNLVTSLMTGIRIHDFNCGLKAYSGDVVKNVKIYGELHRYVPALAHWEGFKVGEIVVKHRPRKYGKTKFGFGRFWKGFLDLITVLFTTRYFLRPLHLFGVWGMLAVIAGFAIDGVLTVEWFLGETALSNRPLFLLGILLIIVGIQFVSIGLLGEMITKTKQTEREYPIRDYIK